MKDVPRGVEVLLKKAAVDAAFRERLLAERSRAAARIGLTLAPAEAAMVDTIPAAQLDAVVAGTRVNPNLHAAFMTYTAAVMLAALGATTLGCNPPGLKVTGNASDMPAPTGVRPDWPPTAETAAEAKETGAVVGRVVDDGGKPLAGARVEVVGTTMETTSGADGRFTLAGVPAGTYSIYATYAGYHILEPKAVAVTAGAAAEVVLTLTYISPPGGARPDLPGPPGPPGPVETGIRADILEGE